MAKNDFVLNIGFKIDNKSISKTALRQALNKAAEGAILKISKIKLDGVSRIRKDITKQLGTVAIDNLSVSARASKAFSKSINDKVKPTIKSLSVSAGSLSNLRKSVERALQNINVTAKGLNSQLSGPSSARQAGRQTQPTRDAKSTQQSLRGQVAAQENSIRNQALLQSSLSKTAIVQQRVNQSMKQGGFNLQEVGVKIGQVTKRFAEYSLSVKAIQAVQLAVRATVQGVVELDGAIRDLAKVGSVGTDIDKSFDALGGTALSTGRSIKDTSDAIGEFVRQGKDLATAAKFAEQALKLSNISALNGADAARLATAAQQVFGSTAEELGAQLSSLAVFADSSATNVTEVGQAFLRSASSASAAGFTIEESFALLAATLEQTRLQSATVGTAFKTVLARLGRDKGKVADLANSFTGLRKGQEGYVDATAGTPQVLDQLAASFSNFNNEQKSAIALSVAGVRQQNVLIGLLDNYEKAQTLVNNSQKDSTALNEKNEQQLLKLETRLTNLGTSIKLLGASAAGLSDGKLSGFAEAAGIGIDQLANAADTLRSAFEGLQSLGLGGNDSVLSVISKGALLAGIRASIVGVTTLVKSAFAFFNAGQAANQTIITQGKLILNNNQLSNQRNATEQQTNRTLQQRNRILRDNERVASRTQAKSVAGGAGASGSIAKSAGAFALAAVSIELVSSGAELLAVEMGSTAEEASEASDAVGKLATAALIGAAAAGKFGFGFAGIAASLITISAAVKKFNKSLEEASVNELTEAIKTPLIGDIVDLSALSKAIVGSVEEITAGFRKELASGDLNREVGREIFDAARGVAEAVNQAKRELEGFSSGAAGLLSRLSDVSSSIENLKLEAVVTTAEDVFGGQQAIDKLASGEARDIQISSDEISRLASERSKVASELVRLQSQFDSERNLFSEVVDKIKSLKDIGSTELVDTIKGLGLDDNGRVEKAITDVISRGGSTGDAITKAVEGLDGQLSKATKPLTDAISSSQEALGAIDGVIGKLEKEGKSRLIELSVARAELNELAKQAPQLAELELEKIKNATQELSTRLSKEQDILRLKDRGLSSQIQAVIEEKRLTIQADKNLKIIREQIKLRKEVGGDVTSLKQTETKAVAALEERARAEAAPLIRKLVSDDAKRQVEDANQKVEASEKKRIKSLSELQKANQQVVSAQKAVVSASSEVDGALLSIASAQSDLSKAIATSVSTIRSSIKSALQSAGFEKLSGITTVFDGVLSREQRLAILRREGLQESLKIAQQQASTLFSIGERLATGGPGARLEAQRGLSVAQSLQGGASISQFSPDQIASALDVAELFPGLKESIQTQALASVGLDDELANLRKTIVGSAGGLSTDEANEQIRLASAQLSSLQGQLDVALDSERIASDDLRLSQDAASSDKLKLDVARAQVVIQERMLEETKFQNRNIIDLKSVFSGGSVGNAARGTLSSGEFSGLVAAAKREKSLMPAGSKLMLANTSETVLTRKQSRRVGFSPRSQSYAAGGNADVSGLASLMSGLLNEIRSLRADVRSGGVSNVSLQVDTNKNINVKGIEGLSQRLQSELQGKFATGSDVGAIESAIIDIITKLGENGLADDLGR